MTSFLTTSGPKSTGAVGPYPDIADVSHADPATAGFFRSFFTAKSNHEIDATQAHFNPDLTVYFDATVGWGWPTYLDLKAVWDQYMPQWNNQAKSYPVRIIGDMTGAAILMTDTPELFGGEIRAIGIIDMQDDKIVRWVDYWDGRGFGSSAVSAIRVPAESYPQQLGLDVVTGQHSAVLGDAVNALTSAIKSGDPALLEEQFTYDVVFEDLALRSIVRGRAAVSRYLRRGLGTLPYSTADVRHVVGSDHGGGFEWRAEGADIPRGAAALTLDAAGKVSSLTFVWDGSLLDDPQIAALTALAVEPQR